MQKWLPEPFEDFSAPVAAVAGAVLDAQAATFETAAAETADEATDRDRLFLSEKGFKGPEAMMSHLTPEERAQVFDLVEQDISRDYEEREKEIVKENARQLEEARQNFDLALDQWTARLAAAQAEHLRETAAAAARLALQLAEKIIRDRVVEDPSVLTRGLETALFKLEGARGVTVCVNPEETDWLKEKGALLERLGIEQVLADRRVERGGCLVRTELKEWDATIKGQLAYLSELVEEMIATQDPPDLSGKDDTDVDPGLD